MQRSEGGDAIPPHPQFASISLNYSPVRTQTGPTWPASRAASSHNAHSRRGPKSTEVTQHCRGQRPRRTRTRFTGWRSGFWALCFHGKTFVLLFFAFVRYFSPISSLCARWPRGATEEREERREKPLSLSLSLFLSLSLTIEPFLLLLSLSLSASRARIPSPPPLPEQRYLTHPRHSLSLSFLVLCLGVSALLRRKAIFSFPRLVRFSFKRGRLFL